MRVEFEGLIEDSRLNAAGATCLYRIAQESLRNAFVHGHAATIHVILKAIDDCIQLKVLDDGTGFSPDQEHGKRGLGFVSMAERVRLLGGNLDVDSRPGAGTTITASVPWEEVTHATNNDIAR